MHRRIRQRDRRFTGAVFDPGGIKESVSQPEDSRIAVAAAIVVKPSLSAIYQCYSFDRTRRIADVIVAFSGERPPGTGSTLTGGRIGEADLVSIRRNCGTGIQRFFGGQGGRNQDRHLRFALKLRSQLLYRNRSCCGSIKRQGNSEKQGKDQERSRNNFSTVEPKPMCHKAWMSGAKENDQDCRLKRRMILHSCWYLATQILALNKRQQSPLFCLLFPEL